MNKTNHGVRIDNITRCIKGDDCKNCEFGKKETRNGCGTEILKYCKDSLVSYNKTIKELLDLLDKLTLDTLYLQLTEKALNNASAAVALTAMRDDGLSNEQVSKDLKEIIKRKEEIRGNL